MEYFFNYNIVGDTIKADEINPKIKMFVETLRQYATNKIVDRMALRNQFAYLLKKFPDKLHLQAAINLFNTRSLTEQDENGIVWVVVCPFDPENKSKAKADFLHTFGALLHSYYETFDDQHIISLISETKKHFKIK